MASIKNLLPQKNSRYEQGYYVPKFPNKYKGNLNSIIIRSSYERRMCQICDLDERIIQWSSEPIAIEYQSIVDNKLHKYWLDFWIKLDNKKEYIVEVKPKSKLKKPRKSKNQVSYNYRLKEYLVNMSKFNAAVRFAKSVDMEFIIAEESFLFKIK